MTIKSQEDIMLSLRYALGFILKADAPGILADEIGKSIKVISDYNLNKAMGWIIVGLRSSRSNSSILHLGGANNKHWIRILDTLKAEKELRNSSKQLTNHDGDISMFAFRQGLKDSIEHQAVLLFIEQYIIDLEQEGEESLSVYYNRLLEILKPHK